MNGAADQSEVNHLKTGVLFVAAVEMAAAILELRDERLTRLQRCALHLGQAFQLMDDFADEAEDGFARNATGSVIPLSGRRDGRVRLERHLRSALAELEPSGQLADLIRSTFSRCSSLAGIATPGGKRRDALFYWRGDRPDHDRCYGMPGVGGSPPRDAWLGMGLAPIPPSEAGARAGEKRPLRRGLCRAGAGADRRREHGRPSLLVRDRHHRLRASLCAGA